MPVSDKHPDYLENLSKWQLVKDCVSGSKAIKSRKANTLKGDAYLPVPNPEDLSDANKARYESYLQRANYVNFTGHTKKGMTGMVFRKDMICELPQSIDYIKENATGGGLSLEQLIKDILGNTLETARYGLLVDYPAADDNLTKSQVADLELEASILPYEAQSIINWRTTVINGKKKLSLVVLAEPFEKIADDGFSFEKVINHRVLKLVDGLYIQELHDHTGEIIQTFEPTMASGERWKEIPFIFIGAQNNDETVDDAPLYDLAEVNLAHYRNSADYEESSFMVGQPTPILSGLTAAWVKDVLKGKVMLGSRSAVPLPEGGAGSLLQASPNSMPMEGMKAKEEQMIKIGARVIQDNSGNETAEAAKIRFAGQNSELASIVGNIEQALMIVFDWLGMFMGDDVEAELEINRQFYESSLDAQQVMALIQLADRGDISQTDIRAALRKTGFIDSSKTDDEIDSEIEDRGAGLMLTDETNQMQTTDPQLIEILKERAREEIKRLRLERIEQINQDAIAFILISMGLED